VQQNSQQNFQNLMQQKDSQYVRLIQGGELNSIQRGLQLISNRKQTLFDSYESIEAILQAAVKREINSIHKFNVTKREYERCIANLNRQMMQSSALKINTSQLTDIKEQKKKIVKSVKLDADQSVTLLKKFLNVLEIIHAEQ